MSDSASPINVPRNTRFNYEGNKHALLDSMGRCQTLALFAETRLPSVPGPAPFSLAAWKERYVAIADPTEYRAAMELLGDWEHWLRLRESPALAKHFDAWRREVEIRLRSEAIVELQKQAKAQTGTGAAKWLAEGGFSGRETRGNASERKRTKGQQEEAAIREQVSQKVKEDAERLGLTVITGTK